MRLHLLVLILLLLIPLGWYHESEQIIASWLIPILFIMLYISYSQPLGNETLIFLICTSFSLSLFF